MFATIFAIATVFERKGIGRIQNRYGPNRVGIPFTNISLFGFGQADRRWYQSDASRKMMPDAARGGQSGSFPRAARHALRL